jgi:hypothetical protein
VEFLRQTLHLVVLGDGLLRQCAELVAIVADGGVRPDLYFVVAVVENFEELDRLV